MKFITGTMFGGKSAELIRCIEEDKAAGLTVYCFKPEVDTRDGMFIKSRETDTQFPALPIGKVNMEDCVEWGNSFKALLLKGSVDKVYVDEIQFLTYHQALKIILLTKHTGIELVFAGLNRDFRHRLFPTARLALEFADDIVFLKGDCNRCSEPALYNVRMSSAGTVVTEGAEVEVGSDQYQVLCVECYKERTSL